MFSPIPQVLKNISSPPPHAFLKDPAYQEAISQLQESFPKERILIRPSGTEPLVRVMVEGEEEEKIKDIADQAIQRIQRFQSSSVS